METTRGTASDRPAGARATLVLLAATTGLVFGYSIAVGNDAIGFIRTELSLSSLQAAVVVSGLVAGALAGCLVAGPAADRWGRRQVLLVAAVTALVGTALTAVAPGLLLLVVGRLITGLAVGSTSAVAPLYLAELAEPRMRGGLLACYQLFIAIGILAALAVGLLFTPGGQWRWMIAVGLVPPALQLVGVTLVPPSPRRLARQGRADEARAALLRLRAPHEVESELAAVLAEPSNTKPSVTELLRPQYRRALVVGLTMALMNALVGVGAVIYYSTDVFRIAGIDGPSSPAVASLAVGGVNTLAAVGSLWLTSRIGRRPLLSVGLAGIALTLVVAGIDLALPPELSDGALLVGAILAFMAFFAVSAGPLAWLLVAEVFPTAVRAPAVALATAANWAANLVIALLFPIIAGTPGVPGRVAIAFWFFAVLTIGFLIFVRLQVPETKDRTLEEIEKSLRPA